MIKTWEIPRSDKRNRCGICLKPFKKGQFRYINKKINGYRFNRACIKCRNE